MRCAIKWDSQFKWNCQMSNDVSGIGELALEMESGQCAVMAALVIALHENGVLPLAQYCNVLHRLWVEMPEEKATGEGGAVIERMLELLGTHVSTPGATGDAKGEQDVSTIAAEPVNDVTVTRPVVFGSKSVLQAANGAARRT